MPSWRPFRIVTICVISLVGAAGVAVASTVFTKPIAKNGNERRLIVQLNAPYGSVEVRPGTDRNSVAAIQLTDEDAATKSPHWTYGLIGKDIGILKIGIGTDEGMLGGP